jgi:hypothetical protein
MGMVQPQINRVVEIVGRLVVFEKVGEMADMKTSTVRTRTIKRFPWERDEG